MQQLIDNGKAHSAESAASEVFTEAEESAAKVKGVGSPANKIKRLALRYRQEHPT